VTGRHSNQLNYHSVCFFKLHFWLFSKKVMQRYGHIFNSPNV
jgi:hypothetical protein